MKVPRKLTISIKNEMGFRYAVTVYRKRGGIPMATPLFRILPKK